MTWVKVDDNTTWDPRVRSVTVPARWVYVAARCLMSKNLTDGNLLRGDLTLVDGTIKIARELVAAGLWETTAEGWRDVDYLPLNRSRARAQADIEQRRVAGARGLASRYSEPHSEMPSESLQRVANRDAVAGRLAERAISLSDPLISDPVADHDPGEETTERERESSESPSEKPSESLAKPRRRNLTEDVIAELQEDHPELNVRAAAADYLNWSGSAKHIDKVQGLRNQLADPVCARKFPAAVPPADKWRASRDAQQAVRDRWENRERNEVPA